MIKIIVNKTRFAIAAGVALLVVGSSNAGDDKCLVIDDKCPVECCKENPGWCKLFDYSSLYENENNCLIQKVSLTGRYHGQHHSSSLDYSSPLMPDSVGTSYWEHRRFRLGAKVQFLNDFTFFNEWNISNNEYFSNQAFFDNIDTMGIKWAPSKDFYISVGKQKAKITREFSTSSKNILTFERSFITNEVIASSGKPWGVTTGFKALGIKHELGAWLSGVDAHPDDRNSSQQGAGPRWPAPNSAGALTYRAATDLNDCTTLHFDYMFTNNSDAVGRGNFDRLEASPYNHVIALGTDTEWDLGCCDRKAGLVTDFVWGVDRQAVNGSGIFGASNNRAQGEDTFGIVLMPHYDLTERLQLVGRYAYASEARMHRPQRAVHTEAVAGGPLANRPLLEDVHTFYLGLNYRLCGDKLKFMAGYEYLAADVEGGGVDNGNVTGDTWMLGVRTYW